MIQTSHYNINRKTQSDYIRDVKNICDTINVIGTYINNKTKIAHQCKIDGYIWVTAPSNILSGCGCPLCAGKEIGQAPEYKNSIWDSEYREYFSKYLTEDQMKQYMPYSSKSIVATCPNCGTTKKTTPALLIRRGIKCQMCSDGISYPNKFSRAFISQINGISRIEYEYSPKWLIINGHRCFYDIYFEYHDKKYVIEVDGMLGHGNSDCFTKDSASHSIEQDREKDFLAQHHGIQVIRIDAKKSEAEYLKQNIMNSILPNILNFQETDIDWDYCKQIAVSSFMIEAGKLWDEGLLIKDIALKLKISSSTVKRYLIALSELNACTYSKNIARKRVGQYQSGANGTQSKQTIRLSDLKIYGSATEAAFDNNLSKDMIYYRCKKHKDFMYYDEWLESREKTN